MHQLVLDYRHVAVLYGIFELCEECFGRILEGFFLQIHELGAPSDVKVEHWAYQRELAVEGLDGRGIVALVAVVLCEDGFYLNGRLCLRYGFAEAETVDCDYGCKGCAGGNQG